MSARRARIAVGSARAVMIAVVTIAAGAAMAGFESAAEAGRARAADRIPADEAAGAVWRAHVKGVTDVAFLAGGTKAVSCSLDGTIRLWDAPTGVPERTLAETNDELFALSASRDGRTIVACAYSGKIAVLSPSGGEIRILGGIKGWSADVALSPDGRFAAVWSMDGNIRIFDLETGDGGGAFKGQPNRWGMALAWSPDGRYLAAGRAAITIWDSASAGAAMTLEGPQDFIRDLAFSPDGRFLASACMDKTVRVWDLGSGKELYALQPEGLAVFPESGPRLTPARLPMTAVAFSPDGSKLATGGADRVVRLWNAADGKPIRNLVGHTMTVMALAFPPDGRTLLSASLDRTIRAWKVE